ncbi:MAG: metalloregulator ArsR/SmtB family transcription factor [Ghiorsea sp.]|nr:metalloregulator ArsR/SmtB family transcription factor [Ghiorsea sp.]
MQLTPLFKGLSDPVRLRIFYALARKGELCVCHLTDALKLPQSTVSRHLNTLKHAGLVVSERRAKWVYYALDESSEAAKVLAALVCEQGEREPQLQQDLENIRITHC